jgi:hypothetical protein
MTSCKLTSCQPAGEDGITIAFLFCLSEIVIKRTFDVLARGRIIVNQTVTGSTCLEFDASSFPIPGHSPRILRQVTAA